MITPPTVERPPIGRELDVLKPGAHIHQLHPEAEIRLIHPIALDRLREGEAGKRSDDLSPHQETQLLDERLNEREDHLGCGERHLHINLRELRLAIRAQILVAKATHDLEVPIESRHHQELFEELR